MVVLLPRCGRGSKTVEWLVRRLKPKRLASELKAMPSASLRVRFSKFSVETTLDNELISTLKKMRMRKPFSSTVDLTNFAPDGGLLVSGAIHKALIQVDEGVQTAAATASVLKGICPVRPEKTLKGNRSFVFYIKDNESNSILSMGVYRGP
ncbi:putative serine proteinase inhibitor [Penaeus vannamei]|uniref:Putative serine proteinase inhibitor n=1 Tax=Penaeus vannamei TaxID=6689 RepID=A0A3R7P971_PENVA|nr:putative serine proteinase inhibitor [Penaeus vannamei]